MPKLDLSKALTTDHTIAHKRAKPTPSPKATLSPQITTISPKKTPTPPPSPPTKSPAPTLEIPETPILAPTTSPSHLLSRTPSPLPSNPPPNLWWSDSEITGHDPKDPTDDGYGINGVGFIPTPAIAAARHERRKRQLVEYKNRQDREARQRRGERRRRMDREGSGVGDAGKEVARKVRFLEI
ncbi:hypothetical protein MMC12_005749 [Toensbergia leucococca]|nr:hypothetical protein [Toensbergia leucococca]